MQTPHSYKIVWSTVYGDTSPVNPTIVALLYFVCNPDCISSQTRLESEQGRKHHDCKLSIKTPASQERFARSHHFTGKQVYYASVFHPEMSTAKRGQPVQEPTCFFSQIRRACLLILFASLSILGAKAKPPAPSPLLTQRQINVFAAELDRVIYTVVDGAGLRRSQESLPDYLRRIALRIDGETQTQYQKRIESYLSVFLKADRATASLRRLPPLRDTSPTNHALWQKTIKSLNYLPGRLARMQAVWKRAKSEARPSGNNTFGQELDQTLNLILFARDCLRDARP